MNGTLNQASHQWATRPADERFTSLTEMLQHFKTMRSNSRQLTVASRELEVAPSADHKGLTLHRKTADASGNSADPTHWSFGQLAARAEAPAGYLRTMPAEIAADCINYGLQYKRQIEDVGLLLYRNGSISARAITGPTYGRIWNADIVQGLTERFGDGFNGDWKVPGEFKKDLSEVTKENTTLFGGDRDMFVFLADEKNRVEIPNRRDGQAGTLGRGFFVWNSEVGAATFGVATFLFDYVCCNRIVWGAKEYKQVTIRHTPKAPVRWVDELAPALTAYANSSTGGITRAIEHARQARIDDVGKFLTERFGKRMPAILQDVALAEEGKPIETLWDAACAVTAHARSILHQDDRVDLERKAGALLDMVA